jgi:hypothetical protein
VYKPGARYLNDAPNLAESEAIGASGSVLVAPPELVRTALKSLSVIWVALSVGRVTSAASEAVTETLPPFLSERARRRQTASRFRMRTPASCPCSW